MDQITSKIKFVPKQPKDKQNRDNGPKHDIKTFYRATDYRVWFADFLTFGGGGSPPNNKGGACRF